MILGHGSKTRLWDTCYMTPRTVHVAALLVIFLTETFSSCSFRNSPISSTFEDKIETLLKHFPLDYRTTTVSNIQTDSWCSDIWKLHFLRKELKRIESVSGKKLKVQINMVLPEVEFLAWCRFNESNNCLALELMNITVFLSTMSHILNNMRDSIKNDFSNCTWINCESGPSESSQHISQTESTATPGTQPPRPGDPSTPATSAHVLTSATDLPTVAEHLYHVETTTLLQTNIVAQAKMQVSQNQPLKKRKYYSTLLSIIMCTILLCILRKQIS